MCEIMCAVGPWVMAVFPAGQRTLIPASLFRCRTAGLCYHRHACTCTVSLVYILSMSIGGMSYVKPRPKHTYVQVHAMYGVPNPLS